MKKRQNKRVRFHHSTSIVNNTCTAGFAIGLTMGFTIALQWVSEKVTSYLSYFTDN